MHQQTSPRGGAGWSEAQRTATLKEHDDPWEGAGLTGIRVEAYWLANMTRPSIANAALYVVAARRILNGRGLLNSVLKTRLFLRDAKEYVCQERRTNMLVRTVVKYAKWANGRHLRGWMRVGDNLCLESEMQRRVTIHCGDLMCALGGWIYGSTGSCFGIFGRLHVTLYVEVSWYGRRSTQKAQSVPIVLGDWS